MHVSDSYLLLPTMAHLPMGKLVMKLKISGHSKVCSLRSASIYFSSSLTWNLFSFSADAQLCLCVGYSTSAHSCSV